MRHKHYLYSLNAKKTKTMIAFPNAKINLGLQIVERRPDGYHNLETIFYPIPVEDALEFCVKAGAPSKCQIKVSGIRVEGPQDDNLVCRAYRLLDEQFDLPAIEIHLHKAIPTGAGLGGGSSDAAYMLRLLNNTFELHLTTTELENYAAMLGADCAFFIQNRPTFAHGIGNLFRPIQLSLLGYQLWLIKPDIFVSTREAFAQITPRRPEVCLEELVKAPISSWREAMVNDFEASVFPQHPELAAIKQRLYDRGALYAAMSGSGSSLFGIFAPDATLPEKEDFGPNTFQWQGRLR